MDNTHPEKKRSLNNTLINIINFIGILVIVFGAVFFVLGCLKKNISTSILSCLLIISSLLNMHWLSKEKN